MVCCIMDELFWLLIFLIGFGIGYLSQPKPNAVKKKIHEAIDRTKNNLKGASGVHNDVLDIRFDDLDDDVDDILDKAGIP
jgi:hypothetical protein